MAMRSAAASPFCRPEEDPFLLLESSLKAIERILQLRRGLPMQELQRAHHQVRGSVAPRRLELELLLAGGVEL